MWTRRKDKASPAHGTPRRRTACCGGTPAPAPALPPRPRPRARCRTTGRRRATTASGRAARRSQRTTAAIEPEAVRCSPRACFYGPASRCSPSASSMPGEIGARKTLPVRLLVRPLQSPVLWRERGLVLAGTAATGLASAPSPRTPRICSRRAHTSSCRSLWHSYFRCPETATTANLRIREE